MPVWPSPFVALAVGVVLSAFSHHLRGEVWRVLVALGLFRAVGLSLGSLVDRLLLLSRNGSILSASAVGSTLRYTRYVRDTTLPMESKDLSRGSVREIFRLRRARLDVRGEPAKGILYRLQLDDAMANGQIKDAYLQLSAGHGMVTFWHFKTPSLEEALESSAARRTPERTQVSDKLCPDGGRDRGIAYTFRWHSLP